MKESESERKMKRRGTACLRGRYIYVQDGTVTKQV